MDHEGSALKAIEAELARLDAEEGFTPELLDIVDLTVAFSPVIAIRGEPLNAAVNATKTVGGKKYLVQHPLISGAVDEESLKRMRLRYLLALKAQQRIEWAIPGKPRS